jgi:hypothetical protein
MESNSIPAGFGVVRYLGEHIMASDILSTYDYKGLTPIVPIQDEPALLQVIGAQDGISTAPYIVYTWYNNGIDTNYYLTYDTVVFTIKSLDQKAARQLVLLMKNLFRRWDESGQAVNRYVAGKNFGALDAQYKEYNYKYISLWALTGGLPGTIDMEPVHATVTIRVGFTWDGNSQPLPELP